MHDIQTKKAHLTEGQTDTSPRWGGLAGILGSLLMLFTFGVVAAFVGVGHHPRAVADEVPRHQGGTHGGEQPVPRGPPPVGRPLPRHVPRAAPDKPDAGAARSCPEHPGARLARSRSASPRRDRSSVGPLPGFRRVRAGSGHARVGVARHRGRVRSVAVHRIAMLDAPGYGSRFGMPTVALGVVGFAAATAVVGVTDMAAIGVFTLIGFHLSAGWKTHNSQRSRHAAAGS